MDFLTFYTEGRKDKQEDDFISSCIYGELDVVKDLFFRLKKPCKKIINYALSIACNNGHIEILKFMIDQGVDLTVLKNIGWGWSYDTRSVEMTKFLLQYLPPSQSFLEHSSRIGDLEIVKLLVEGDKGDKISNHLNKDEAIRLASIHGNVQVMKYLFLQGADKKKCTDTHERLLENLKIHQNKKVMKIFLESTNLYSDVIGIINEYLL